MRDAVAEWIADHDPGLLLYSSHDIPAKLRYGLIEWWLATTANERVVRALVWSWHVRDHLDHSELARQLRPYLTDPARSIFARTPAIDISGSTLKTELEQELIELSLADTQPIALRWKAVRVLCEFENQSGLGVLLRLLENQAGIERVREPEVHYLRAYAMKALWPNHLSTVDALQMLERHKVTEADEYGSVFDYDFTEGLSVSDLVDVISWFRNQKPESFGTLDRIAERVASRAVGKLNIDSVREAV